MPENITKILNATGLIKYFNSSAITDLTYKPIDNANAIQSIPNLGDFLQTDANLKIANVASMNNQKFPSGIFLPIEAVYIIAVIGVAAIVTAIVHFKKSNKTNEPRTQP